MRALQFAILIAVTLTAITPTFAQDSELDKYPYMAKVTGNDVYVRSGPGTAYYYTQKLSTPQQVIVVGKKYDWLKIIPPQNSFSWISKRYVEPVQGNPNIGIVTGENVRVYAGSPNVSPRNSSSLQTKLSEGEHVKLTGDEMEDYYKITPPATAYLWMSEQFLEYVGPVKEQTKPVTETKPTPKPEPKPLETKPKPEPQPQTQEKQKTEESTEQQTPTTESTETTETPTAQTDDTQTEQAEQPQPEEQTEEPQTPDAVRLVFDLEQAINNEVLKPLEKQDFSEYKTQLNEVIETQNAPQKALRYAQFLLERIERFELVKTSQRQLDQQQKQLEKIRQKIKKQRQQLIAEIPDPGKYLVIGTFEKSHIYTEESGEKRYVIYDPENRVLCYAVPAGDLKNFNMDPFLGEKVGLDGSTNADEITPSTIVRFDVIVELE